ncbi:MAG: methionine synthase / methylenetetrahydrofolate reductase [Verrucomicrobiota bacterium]
MGTLLLEAGIPLTRCFEELCVSEPDRIEAIHQQYIAAGARVIGTNTFGGNAVRLERFGFEERVAEINRAAAQIAVKAAHRKGIHVAGSVGPLGIKAEEAAARGIDRARVFREQISALLEGGVDLIFCETFMDFAEMEIALRAANDSGAPLVICSFACTPEARISFGMALVDAFAKLNELGAKIVGVNCTNGPQAMAKLLDGVPAQYVLSIYPNAGYPKYYEGRFVYHTTPDCFAQSAREMVAKGARLIGGCCGTNASHVAAIAGAIAEMRPVSGKALRVP